MISPPPARRRINARTGLAAALSLSMAACAVTDRSTPTPPHSDRHPIVHAVSPEDAAAVRSEAPLRADRVVLWVNGLGCPLCASNIDKQLARVDGVQAIAVDLSQGKVTLTLKPGAAHPSPARLSDAVEDAGFTLVKVEVR
jgi:copper chaperone CopZ